MSTLQYYFGNREDLLVAIFRHECRRELAEVEAAVARDDDPWEQIVRLVQVGVAGGDRSVRTWRTWVEFWRASLRDAELREEAHGVYCRWRESVRRVVANGIASGRFGSDVDAAVISYQLTAIIDGIGIPVALADPGLPVGAEGATGLVIDAIARLLQIDPEQTEGAPDVLEDPLLRAASRPVSKRPAARSASLGGELP